MGARDKRNNREPMICLCNGVSKKTIEEAIAVGGCNSLGRLFDETLAGVGACGGTCQPTLRKMLETFRETGKFPENPRHPDAKRRR